MVRKKLSRTVVLKLECKLKSSKDLVRGALWATVHGVTESDTTERLTRTKDLVKVPVLRPQPIPVRSAASLRMKSS